VPLLVVPLDRDETGLLTLEEYEALLSCEVVWFHDPAHPLRKRLDAAGVTTSATDEPAATDARRSGWGLVIHASSPDLVPLAKAGAEVTAGPAAPVDPLTAAHGARVVRRAAAATADLATVMARLRSGDGCPWDGEQTHESLEVHLLEEAHEVLDAIDAGLTGAELEEELGDVLLQVAFHACVADQEGRFDLASVARRIVTKLVDRHPHVFGQASVASAHEVVANWEAMKNEEKARLDPFEGIPDALPALLSASKVQKRAASVGWEADEGVARRRLHQSLELPATAESVGDALFWLVAVAGAAGIEPEGALRRAITRFKEAAAGRPPSPRDEIQRGSARQWPSSAPILLLDMLLMLKKICNE
jgi:MazG family protein